MNPKFKVGDRVVAVRSDYPDNFPVGTVGTVADMLDEHCDVISDSSESTGKWFFFEAELEHFVEPVEEGNLTLAEEFEMPVIDPVTITYKGISITLDVNIQGSKMFAEVLLNTIYAQGAK